MMNPTAAQIHRDVLNEYNTQIGRYDREEMAMHELPQLIAIMRLVINLQQNRIKHSVEMHDMSKGEQQ